MAEHLIQSLPFTNVGPSGTQTVAHDLNVGGVAVKPDLIAFDQPGFTATATAADVTVTNHNAGIASANAILVYFHSVQRAFGAAGVDHVTPDPFVIAAPAVPTPAPPGPPAPSTLATYTQDFINTAGYSTTVTGTASAHLTNTGNLVGAMQLSLNGAADTADVVLNAGGADASQIFGKIGLGKLTVEWLFSTDLVPSALADYDLRVGCENGLPPWPNTNTGLAFLASFSANGNANWWGVLDAANKFDLGVAVDRNPHRFTVVYDPSVPSVTWAIDGVVKHTFNGTPSIDGLAATIGVDMLANNAGGTPDVAIDYIYFTYEITRP